MTSFAASKPQLTQTGQNRGPTCTVCKMDLALQFSLNLA